MDVNSRTPSVRKANVTHFSAGRNLAASIDLLEDVRPSPTSILRGLKTPANFKTPRHDISTIPRHESSRSPGFTDSTWIRSARKEKHMVFSTPVKQLTFKNVSDDSPKTSNLSLTVWAENDPGLKTTENLYEEFLESYKSHPSEHQLFELVESYEKLCDDHVNTLRSMLKKTTLASQHMNRTVQVLNLLQNERNTWRLVRTLYKDRLQSAVDSDAMIIDMVGKRLSDKEIAINLYERDANVRQNQLVIDWLERSAAIKLDTDNYEKAEYFAEQSVTWENTLTRMQQGVHMPGVNRIIVSEMDPDAPIRQDKPLDDLDKEDDARMLKFLLAYIRAGQLEAAQKLCIKFGQPWRAATFEGWRLSHDPNYKTVADDGKVVGAEGNCFRDVWKVVCWRMAEEERFSLTERALYAALSGNLNALLPLCSSWDDYLWAYFRVMVDVRVEQEIRSNSQQDQIFEPLPTAYWDRSLTSQSLFQELQSTPNSAIQTEAKQHFQVVQKFVILDDLDGLLETVTEWIDGETVLPHHLTRFLAHIVLFFRSIGKPCREEQCTIALEAYVKNLIGMRQAKLVSSYAATLPRELQVQWYAKFLEGVTDRSERQMCLQLAEEAGLDVPVITKLVVENIRNQTTTDRTAIGTSQGGTLFNAAGYDLQAETTPEDMKKIDSIDWLVFDPSQRAEALRQANSLIRLFLASKKVDAARAVFEKIPPDSIAIISQHWQTKSGMTSDLPANDDNACREYLCINTYLQALDSFGDWFQHFHHNRPEAPRLAATASFSERVAYEHLEKQYLAELDRWQHSLQLQTKMTVDRLYNVLLFVDGGWMVDQRPNENGSEDRARATQLQRLRELCLPQVALLLQAALHATKQHRTCLQLADVLASEQHKLYEVFRKEDLHLLLDKFRESSLVLLDANFDALGYLIR